MTRAASGLTGAGRRVALSLLALLALAACTSDPGPSSAPSTSSTIPPPGTPTPEQTETETETPAPATGTAAPPADCAGTDVVEVGDADALQSALDQARPGQTIRLAAGTYEGNFVATAQADAAAPILLCGGRDAVLDGGDVDGDYTLHLRGATSWHLLGFTLTGGNKGLMVDSGTGHRIEGLLVTSMGDEAIHLRTNSSDNVVVGNTVRDTGLRKPQYGEGIYVGSAESNWCRQTGCDPDRSDRNVIEGNDIAGTTAEAVDIKEGTTGGVLRDNVFDGSAMVEADSWVDVKGNDWLVEGNRGTTSAGDGFQVHDVVDGWGRGTVFIRNTATGVAGLAVNAAGNRDLRDSTTVRCDNTSDGNLSNVECVDA